MYIHVVVSPIKLGEIIRKYFIRMNLFHPSKIDMILPLILKLQVKFHSFAYVCVLAQLLQWCPTLCNLWTVAFQAPLSLGLPRQEYWNGLSCPPPGDLPDPETEPASPALHTDFNH